jgi:hypothetical protein
MRHLPLAALPGIVALAAGCGPVPDPRLSPVDLRPPLVQSVQTTGPDSIRVEFDEAAALAAEKTRISPELDVGGITTEGCQAVIHSGRQVPGLPYTLETEARDSHGNTASFIAEFYGYNSRVPRIVVNELIPRGSGNHPDAVELKALSAGDMGGVVLYVGSPSSFDARLVFPSLPVRAGTFIIVHPRPPGASGEVNETSDMTQSRGVDSADTAWDFWMPDAAGLGGNNGAVSVYDRPGGACLDAVIYSNRTSHSDERYRGFGSQAMLSRSEEIVQDRGWAPAGLRVTPEDAVSPEGSTGTRSLCRSSGSADTDGPEDWHVVPTRGASLGADNSDQVWVLQAPTSAP